MQSFFLSEPFTVAPSHFAQLGVLQRHQWHAASRILELDDGDNLVSERVVVDRPLHLFFFIPPSLFLLE